MSQNLISESIRKSDIPSTSCARIREVNLRKKKDGKENQLADQNIEANHRPNDTKCFSGYSPQALKEKDGNVIGENQTLCMDNTLCSTKLSEWKKDISCGNLSQLEVSKIDDLILEHQLKYERLNSIMKQTKAQVLESQEDRKKFVEAYNTCVRDLQDELFKKESELFKCQKELDEVKDELEKSHAEIQTLRANENKKGISASNCTMCDNCKLNNVKVMDDGHGVSLDAKATEERSPHTIQKTEAHCQATPANDTKLASDMNRVEKIMTSLNTSLADLRSPMMMPCTPKGLTRKSRRSSLYTFLSKSTCEVDDKDEILKETIIDLKEVLDCYATLTGLSVSIEKESRKTNEKGNFSQFSVKAHSNNLHKDFIFSLGIDDAYDEIEFTPTYMENPEVDPALVQKLPDCLKEKVYITTDQATLLLRDLLMFVKV